MKVYIVIPVPAVVASANFPRGVLEYVQLSTSI